eukprot:11965878-Ditylum_brightwellii.AAC.1
MSFSAFQQPQCIAFQCSETQRWRQMFTMMCGLLSQILGLSLGDTSRVRPASDIKIDSRAQWRSLLVMGTG